MQLWPFKFAKQMLAGNYKNKFEYIHARKYLNTWQ